MVKGAKAVDEFVVGSVGVKVFEVELGVFCRGGAETAGAGASRVDGVRSKDEVGAEVEEEGAVVGLDGFVPREKTQSSDVGKDVGGNEDVVDASGACFAGVTLKKGMREGVL